MPKAVAGTIKPVKVCVPVKVLGPFVTATFGIDTVCLTAPVESSSLNSPISRE